LPIQQDMAGSPICMFCQSFRWPSRGFDKSLKAVHSLISSCSESPEEPTDKPGPTCVAASDSIVGWWPLDQLGSAAEELINDNHGDYVGSPMELEGADDTYTGWPSVTGIWSYDVTDAVSAEQGIEPYEGEMMVRFINTLQNGPGAENSELFQVRDINLASFYNLYVYCDCCS